MRHSSPESPEPRIPQSQPQPHTDLPFPQSSFDRAYLQEARDGKEGKLSICPNSWLIRLRYLGIDIYDESIFTARICHLGTEQIGRTPLVRPALRRGLDGAAFAVTATDNENTPQRSCKKNSAMHVPTTDLLEIRDCDIWIQSACHSSSNAAWAAHPTPFDPPQLTFWPSWSPINPSTRCDACVTVAPNSSEVMDQLQLKTSPQRDGMQGRSSARGRRSNI